MNDSIVFYLCPTSFYASDTADDAHEHALLCVDTKKKRSICSG